MRATILFVLLCCLLTVAALYQLQAAHWDTSIGDGPLTLAGTLLAAGLFFKALFRALNGTDSATGSRFLPLLFWLGLVSIVATYDLWLNRVNYAPDFLHVSSGSDYGIDGFTLKKDGRYIYWNGSGLGESRSYGTYVQQDSIIILRPDSPRNAPRQSRLLIRPYSLISNPAFTRNSQLYLLSGDKLPTRFDLGYQIIELAAK